MTIKNKQKRVFGRKLGRPLRGARLRAMDTLLPRLSIDAGDLREDGTLAPSSLFDVPFDECWFEIGFGNGEHLVELMRRHPEHAYFGAEPYINGMSNFLKDIQEKLPLNQSPPTPALPRKGGGGNSELGQIRVVMDDAMMLANSLVDECLDGMYILNPDPWHKTRHHKRRIVNRDNLAVFARILKPGGQLVLSTDVPYLADWMMSEVSIQGGFAWEAECADDWRVPPDDWIPTVYETKGAKGATQQVYLFFRKK